MAVSAEVLATLDKSSPIATGLSKESREGVVDILNTLLADEVLLYQKTRNFHWNVRGPHFDQLHGFFEKQYDQLAEIVDEVAERVRMVGGFAMGTLAEFGRHTRLQEEPGQYPTADQMLNRLLADHEAVIRHLRTDLEECVDRFHDFGTNDFLIGLMQQHEKMAWMLRASLG